MKHLARQPGVLRGEGGPATHTRALMAQQAATRGAWNTVSTRDPQGRKHLGPSIAG